MFERYGSLEACVASCSEGTAGFGLWHDIHDFCIRDCFMFDDDCAVQVLTALGSDVDAVCTEDALESVVNGLADFRYGVAADLVA